VAGAWESELLWKNTPLNTKTWTLLTTKTFFSEMVEKTGQTNQPCVEIDGVMLPDVSGEEVENYLVSNNLVKSSDLEPNAPIDSSCSDEEHQRMAQENSSPVRFF